MISFAYLYLVALFLVPSGYALNTPGEIMSVDNDLYNIENVEFSNNFNTVSVYSWHELSIFQKWLVQSNSRYDLYKQTKLQENLSMSDVNKRGKISKEASHKLAIITAYENAMKVNSEITIDYDFKGLYVYTNFGKYANIGSLVVAVDDLSLIDNPNLTYEELYFETLLLVGDDTYQRKQKMTITLETGQTFNLDYKENEFMSFYPKFEIKDTSPKYNEAVDNRNVGGPSGGMIQALSIYTALLNIDLDNKIIAGTGTIDLINNYTIGNIGGIVQKYYTVLENNVDIFIIPSRQYNEIKDYINHDRITVITANNFVELIAEIQLLKESSSND